MQKVTTLLLITCQTRSGATSLDFSRIVYFVHFSTAYSNV